MPDRTGIFLGWSANLSNFLGLGVEAGASPMYPQKMRVPPLGTELTGFRKTFDFGTHADSQQECFQEPSVCLYC